MATINELSAASELCQAVYSNLGAGAITAASLEYKANGEQNMSVAQREDVAARYTVERVFNDPATGVYAAVFKEKLTGTTTLAVRGTDGMSDWLNANAHLAVGIPPALSPQFNALRPVVAQWIQSGALQTGSAIAGHSLGGYLAAAIKASYPGTFGSTFTFNSPGFAEPLGLLPAVLQSIFGMPVPQTGVVDVRGGAGLSVIAGLGNHLGSLSMVEIESAGATSSDNHSIARLSQSLAVLKLWSELDPTLSLASGNALVTMASNLAGNTLEKAMEAMLRMLSPSSTADIATDDAQQLYVGLLGLMGRDSSGNYINPTFAALAGKVDIGPASAGLASTARSDFAALLALQALSPVVLRAKPGTESLVETALGNANNTTYTAWLADKALSTADRDAGKATYSDQWMGDRAAMLGALILRNQQDVAGEVAGGSGLKPVQYADAASGLQFQIGLNNPLGDKPQVWFGSGTDETSNGKSLGDHLYGGAGNDTLNGLEGNDYLEGNADSDTLDGGAGNDTLLGGTGSDYYDFNGTDFGRDLVIDQDGLGQIRWNGAALPQGLKAADDVWQSADKKVTYTLVTDAGAGRADLLVSFAGNKNRIIVRHWDTASRNLGIDIGFGADMPVPVTSQNYLGDFIKKNNGTTYEFSGNNYVADGVQQDAADQITGSIGNEAFYGLGGDDAILAREGDDYLDGGAGSDVLMGGLGADRILGGAGDDLIYGSSQGALNNPTAVDFTPPVPDFAIVKASGFNWVWSGTRDSEGIVGGFLQYTVSRDDGDGDAGNVIDAGAGEDAVLAGQGDDLVQAGADADEVFGMAGADVLMGGSGGDRLYGDGRVAPDAGYVDDATGALHGADILVGGAGNDILIGQGSDDIVYGGADGDVLWGDDRDLAITTVEFHGADLLFGGAGQDHLYGGARDDQLYGDTEDDLLWGDSGGAAAGSAAYFAASEHGNDELHAGAGNDQLVGEGGADRLYGDDGNDVMAGDFDVAALAVAFHGDDFMDGGDGNDTLFGGGGNDELIGGAGNDWLAGEDQTDVVASSTLGGDDRLDGGSGDDTLMGGNGNDVLIGGAGVDYMIGGAGDDVFDVAGADTRDVGGVPTLFVDTIVASQGRDTIRIAAASAADLCVTRSGDGTLFVRNATEGVGIVAGVTSSVGNFELADGSISLRRLVNDRLETVVVAATDRAEGTLLGGVLNDTLTVRAVDANVVVSGGRGDDVLVLESAAGATVQFAAGDGIDFVGAIARDTLAPLVKNVLEVDSGIDHASVRVLRIGSRRYLLELGGADDGIAFDVPDAAASPLMPANRPFDELRFADGTTLSWQQVIDRGIETQIRTLTVGTSDDDEGVLTNGNDSFNALGGNDYVDGLAGSDTIYGGAGNDSLFGGVGWDQLNGDAGNDILFGGEGDDLLRGGEGDDAYDGGSGSDELRDISTSSNDTYVLRSGDLEMIYDSGGVADRILVQDGIDTARLTVRRSSFALELIVDVDNDYYLSMTGGRISADGVFNDGGDLVAGSVEQVVFEDGTVWGISDLLAKALVGTRFADYIQGFGTADTIQAGSGNDVVDAEAGDDTVFGEAGNDSIYGQDGADHLLGGDGNDYIWGNTTGTDSSTVVSGNGDLYEGGSGDDSLIDREVSSGDVYRLNAGDGQDTIIDWGGTDDRIEFGIGLAPDDITVRVAGANLRFSAADGTTASVSSAFDGEQQSSQWIESVHFADGTVWGWSEIMRRAYQGSAANDTIEGLATADSIDGEGGDDTLYGGAGNDLLLGGEGNDGLWGETGNDALFGDAGDDQISGDAGDDILVGGDGADTLKGGAGSDRLEGQRGNDRLEDSDALSNEVYRVSVGDGNDVIVDGGGMDAIEFGANINPLAVSARRSGSSVVLTYEAGGSVAITNAISENSFLPGKIEEIRFANSTLWTTIELLAKLNEPTSGDDLIYGGTGNDYIDALAGNDYLDGGAGSDTLIGGEGNDTIFGGVGADLLVGGSGDDFLNGGGSADTFEGGAGNDTMYAAADAEIFKLSAGWGHDTYNWLAGGDTVMFDATLSSTSLTIWRTGFGALQIEHEASGSTVLVQGFFNGSWDATGLMFQFDGEASWNLAAIQSRVAGITGTEGSDYITSLPGGGLVRALAGDDTLTGSSAADLLDGGLGDDQMTGGVGNDVYVVDSGGDTVTESSSSGGTDTVRASVSWTLGSNLENLELIGGAAINGTGNSLANRITGNGAGNVLSGGSGADTLLGGAGDDTYVVDNTGDTVTELAGEGVDLVQSSVTTTLAANVENLTLIGTSGISGTGNAANNVITGNSGANVLNGGAGDDTMAGGSGNDTYVVDSSGDVVIEGAGAGTDLVQSAVDYTLSDNVEKLTLTGTAGINGTGNALANTLTGNAGSNVLDGGAGNDKLVGGAGNDTYVVDSTGDVVTESASAGTDTVLSSLTLTLASNVENLTLVGLLTINGTGNTLANVLKGNAAANTLSGGAGIDTMAGGAGDDTYVVDAIGDAIVENVTEGIDLVQSGVSYTLAANVENLTLTGTSAINGTGNSMDNVLVGNSANNALTGGAGNDRLDGGSGTDTMIGGAGNDTYAVNVSSDVVTENANEGVDTVLSAVTLTLGSHVENLTLTGTSAVGGTGNALGNVLVGNSANNTLTGAAGNDTLDGGAGIDTLIGGAGNDTYTLAAGSGPDTISENDATAGNVDVLSVGAGMAADQIWFRQVGSNLEVSIIGTSDKSTISNWYSGSAYHVEQFKTADGKTLLDSQVQTLVSAMAAFAPPAAGQTTLPPDYQAALNPVIASSWT